MKLQYEHIGRVTQDFALASGGFGVKGTDLYLCKGCGLVVADKILHQKAIHPQRTTTPTSRSRDA